MSRRGELRIIGGRWRGRRLRFPAAPGLRPTPDRLRETLFNWLSDWVVGRRVLDLYAGSGALGIEALSRGAREAVFVERSAAVAAALAENLAGLGASVTAIGFNGERRQTPSFPRSLSPTPIGERESSPGDAEALARVERTDALHWLAAQTPYRSRSILGRESRDEETCRNPDKPRNHHPSRKPESEFDLVFVDPPWASALGPASLERLAVGALLASDHRVYLEQPAGGAEPGSRRWETLKTARAGGASARLLRSQDRAAFKALGTPGNL